MSTPNDGGPVFPQSNATTYGEGGNAPVSGGIALKDWFAGQESLSEWDHPEAIPSQVMAEALAGYPRPKHGWSRSTQSQWIAMITWEADWRSALKYIRADAMLKARSK